MKRLGSFVCCALVALLIALTPALLRSGTYPALAEESVAYEALFIGDRGEAVAQMQRALLILGYDPGTSDGVYGPLTQAAVNAFQVDHAPDESEHATPHTLELLYKAVSEIDLTQTVYIAPYSGVRFHLDPKCWGLRSARKVESVTREDAIDQGKTPCLVCAK